MPLITYIKRIAFLSIILTTYSGLAQQDDIPKSYSDKKGNNTTEISTAKTNTIINRKTAPQKVAVLSKAFQELNFKLDNVIIENQMLGARNSTLISSNEIGRD